jgi:hypothetical protein
MSALGHKQTSDWHKLMSALPPKADIDGRSPNVRFVPKADIVGADKLAFARIPQFNSGIVGADTALCRFQAQLDRV